MPIGKNDFVVVTHCTLSRPCNMQNKVFSISLYGMRPILYFCYMVLIPEAEALKNCNALQLCKRSKNTKKSFFIFGLKIGFCLVLLFQ
jgi:hypothetical protein